mgnify:CR=1 FL=1
MENSYSKNLAFLLLATLFISTSGVLGKYIAMPPEAIILFRALFASSFIYLFCKIKKVDLSIHAKKDKISFLISGVFMGAHWVTYFYALKLSNVAIGMLSMFTFPIMTAFLEPFFTKQKLSLTHVFLGILVLVGIYFLVPDFSIENNQAKGILFGIFSALCYSLRNLITKKSVTNYDSSAIMLYQLIVVTIILLPVLFISDISNLESQLPFLVLVALLTTAIGHTMLVNSLQHFSVATASIIGSIQPIFGIIIAYFFINEIPNKNTFIGGSLILLTVIIESLRSKK